MLGPGGMVVVVVCGWLLALGEGRRCGVLSLDGVLQAAARVRVAVAGGARGGGLDGHGTACGGVDKDVVVVGHC